MPDNNQNILNNLANNTGFLVTSASDMKLAIQDVKPFIPQFLSKVQLLSTASPAAGQIYMRIYQNMNEFVASIENKANALQSNASELLQVINNDLIASYNELSASQVSLNTRINELTTQIANLTSQMPKYTTEDKQRIQNLINQATREKLDKQQQLRDCQVSLQSCQSALNSIIGQIKAIQPSYKLSGLSPSAVNNKILALTSGIQLIVAQSITSNSEFRNNKSMTVIEDNEVKLVLETQLKQQFLIDNGIRKSAWGYIQGDMMSIRNAFNKLTDDIFQALTNARNYSNIIQNAYVRELENQYLVLGRNKENLQNRVASLVQQVKTLQQKKEQAVSDAVYKQLEDNLNLLNKELQKTIDDYRKCQADLAKCTADRQRANNDLRNLQTSSSLTPVDNSSQNQVTSVRSDGDALKLTDSTSRSTASTEARIDSLQPSGPQTPSQSSSPQARSLLTNRDSSNRICIPEAQYKAMLAQITQYQNEINMLRSQANTFQKQSPRSTQTGDQQGLNTSNYSYSTPSTNIKMRK
jgi:hypothetical protein